MNRPLLSKIKELPKYLRFFHGAAERKTQFDKQKVVNLKEQCSQVLVKGLPAKRNDLGSFDIPITIGTCSMGKALCDLGSSVNVMPLVHFELLDSVEAQPTTKRLRMADGSIVIPWGAIENVLVKVGKVLIPTDFIILDQMDLNIPIILGQPFLSTARANITVGTGVVTLRVEDETKIFSCTGERLPKKQLETWHL